MSYGDETKTPVDLGLMGRQDQRTRTLADENKRLREVLNRAKIKITSRQASCLRAAGTSPTLKKYYKGQANAYRDAWEIINNEQAAMKPAKEPKGESDGH